MKKTIKLVAMLLIAAVAVVGCPKHKPVPQQTEVDSYDFEAVLAADFDVAINTSMDGETVLFFEAQTVFNGSVTNDEVKVAGMMTVFQLGDRCLTVERPVGAYTNEPVVHIFDPGHWLGDQKIEMEPLPIKFQDAVAKLKAWNRIVPNGDKMTLRCPMSVQPDGEMWKDPQYIFGTFNAGGFVAVNALTGAITELEDGKTQVGALQEKAE